MRHRTAAVQGGLVLEQALAEVRPVPVHAGAQQVGGEAGVVAGEGPGQVAVVDD